MHNGDKKEDPDPLLNVRSAFILFMALVVAVLLGWLTFVATRNSEQGLA